MRMTSWRVPSIAGLALALAPGGTAVAQEFTYSGSIGLTSGDYIFAERTESASFLNGVMLRSGRFGFTVSVPLIYQNSSAVTFIAGTAVPTGGPDAGAVRERQPGQTLPMGPRHGQGGQGGQSRAMLQRLQTSDLPDETVLVQEPGDYELNVGDPMMQASVDIYSGSGAVRLLSVNAFAKAPVADAASGISTGEWDAGGGASLSLGSNSTFVFADAAYWVLGDMEALPLNDILVYGLSVGQSVGSGRWSLMASLSGATAIIDNVDAPLSVGVGVGFAASPTRGFSAGVSFGLSESSPDLSGYVGWQVSARSP